MFLVNGIIKSRQGNNIFIIVNIISGQLHCVQNTGKRSGLYAGGEGKPAKFVSGHSGLFRVSGAKAVP
jgi:hypothetical protein